MKALGVAKLKKAVKAEKQPCILVVNTKDNTVAAKLPRDYDISKYNKYMYMFYYIGEDPVNETD